MSDDEKELEVADAPAEAAPEEAPKEEAPAAQFVY